MSSNFVILDFNGIGKQKVGAKGVLHLGFQNMVLKFNGKN